jgi:phosphoribosylformylglycinamidine cyclo-ligase
MGGIIMKNNQNSMTYAGTGVSYENMDPFKIACQKRASLTSHNAERLGVTSLEWTRGESAYMMELNSQFSYPTISHVEEGLGTKNLIADAMMKITGKSYYDQIAKDTIAMIVNDLITLGNIPISPSNTYRQLRIRWRDSLAARC